MAQKRIRLRRGFTRRRLTRGRFTRRRITRRRFTRRRITRRLAVSRNFRLRSKRSLHLYAKRGAVFRKRFVRDVRRAVTFKIRRKRLLGRNAFLKRRLSALKLRRQAAAKQIRLIIVKRRLLTGQRKSIRRRLLILKNSPNSAAISGYTAKLKHTKKQINRLKLRIRLVKKRKQRISRRIARTIDRMKRIRRRIRVSNTRLQRQIRESRRMFKRAVKNLVRWKVIGPRKIKIVARRNSRAFATLKTNKNKSNVRTMNSRQARKIIRDLKSGIQANLKPYKNLLIYHRRLSGIRKELSKTKRKISRYTVEYRDVTGKLKAERQMHGGRSKRIIKRLTWDLQRIKQARSRKMREQRALAGQARKMQHKISTMKTQFVNVLQKWTSNLMQAGLEDFVSVIYKAINEGERVKRERVKRKRIRSFSLKHRIFTQRTLNRIENIQKKLKRTAKKAGHILVLEQHIQRRRARLSQRVRRITRRRFRLKLRIRTVKNRRQRLLNRVTRLRAAELSIKRRMSGSAIVQLPTFTSKLAHIQTRIVRDNRKIFICQHHISRMKKRRALMKVRIGKILKRRHQLGRRMSAVRRRIRRQKKRLSLLVTRKHRFVKRVLKKKLVRRRLIRRVSKSSRRLILRSARRAMAQKRIRLRRGFTRRRLTRQRLLYPRQFNSLSSDIETNASADRPVIITSNEYSTTATSEPVIITSTEYAPTGTGSPEGRREVSGSGSAEWSEWSLVK